MSQAKLSRVHNFGAGPAALPLGVLERARAELLDFQGAGMSILEMSHRSAVYDRVHNQAIADLKKLLEISDDYSVIFMGGGARTQFGLVPMNLLSEGSEAEYIVTGRWASGALSEANKIGRAKGIWSSEETNYSRFCHLPRGARVG